jgi:hypothetical protein
MLRRTAVRRVSFREFAGPNSVNYLSPYNALGFFYLGFIFAFAYLAKYSLEKSIEIGAVMPKDDLDREADAKEKDPRRPPWPLLHQRVVFMREGKLGHDDLALSWEQCKHYYGHDWLIPLEMAQILKYTSPMYLQTYIDQPDQLRKEVLAQLLKVRYNTSLNRDEEEILDMMIGELKSMSLLIENGDSIPLVPIPGRVAGHENVK